MSIVLPADVYDTLEFSALVYGGIGGRFYRDRDDAPCCPYGHAHEVCEDNEFARTLYASGVTVSVNDDAVSRINARRGTSAGARVSFAKWCAELNVVRGGA